MIAYAAQIDPMDQGIGRVLDAKVGVALGPAGSFTSYGRPWANASNTPFRRFKHWVHEGGISTPFVASWPAAIKNRNQLHHDPAHITDLMPTFAEVAGTKVPSEFTGRQILPGEGISLAPTLRGGKRQLHESIYWEHGVVPFENLPKATGRS